METPLFKSLYNGHLLKEDADQPKEPGCQGMLTLETVKGNWTGGGVGFVALGRLFNWLLTTKK